MVFLLSNSQGAGERRSPLAFRKQKTHTESLFAAISVVSFLRNPLVYRKIFTDDYYPSGYFRRTGTRADSGPLRMSTIAPRDQFKPIRIGENISGEL